MQAKLVAAALATLVLAGCGSSSSSSTTPAPANPGTTTASAFRLWSLSDFLRLSGIRRSADGTSYIAPGHRECASEVILRSTAEVQSYLRSGDVVVTNHDRSAGVKVTGESSACQQRFAQALAKLR
jgi:hypothetical protein